MVLSKDSVNLSNNLSKQLHGMNALFQGQLCDRRAGEISFKVDRPWNTEKYCRPPCLTAKKNVLNSRRSRIAITVTF